eukprot:scaffold1563_cov307-Prasinococcus_capsulatus_cf.AAC.6
MIEEVFERAAEEKMQRRAKEYERKRLQKRTQRQIYLLRHARDYETLQLPVGAAKARPPAPLLPSAQQQQHQQQQHRCRRRRRQRPSSSTRSRGARALTCVVRCARRGHPEGVPAAGEGVAPGQAPGQPGGGQGQVPGHPQGLRRPHHARGGRGHRAARVTARALGMPRPWLVARSGDACRLHWLARAAMGRKDVARRTVHDETVTRRAPDGPSPSQLSRRPSHVARGGACALASDEAADARADWQRCAHRRRPLSSTRAWAPALATPAVPARLRLHYLRAAAPDGGAPHVVARGARSAQERRAADLGPGRIRAFMNGVQDGASCQPARGGRARHASGQRAPPRAAHRSSQSAHAPARRLAARAATTMATPPATRNGPGVDAAGDQDGPPRRATGDAGDEGRASSSPRG